MTATSSPSPVRAVSVRSSVEPLTTYRLPAVALAKPPDPEAANPHHDSPQRATARPTASAQLLVRLLVEPHVEQRELRPRDEQERDEDDRRGGDLVPPEDPRGCHDEAEEEADDG